MYMYSAFVFEMHIIQFLIQIVHYTTAYDLSSSIHGPRFFTEWKEIEENGTLLVKHFTIDSRQFLGVVHTHGLSIYEFNAATLSIIQTIPLAGATSFTFFTINEKHYAAIASSLVYSKLYQWNSTSSSFTNKEELDTEGARDVEFVAIPNSGKFLVFSCNGAPSLVYLWISSQESFTYYQSLMTNNAIKVHSIVTQSSHNTFLTISESGNTPSHVYRWNRTYFDPYQSIDMYGAHELYPYVVGQHTFLVAANKSSTSVFIHSAIKDQFIDYAPLAKALSVSYFSIDSEHFIAVAESSHCGIYRMVGAKFEHFQSIATHGVLNVHIFSLQIGCQLLAVVGHSGNITLYKWTSISSNDRCST